MERRIKTTWVTAGLLLCVTSLHADTGLASSFKVARATLQQQRTPTLEGVQAFEEPAGMVLSDKTTEVSVVLDKTTVKCSQADYAAPMLKVLIPALAELTILNHRNTAEGAPCVSAGNCFEMGPELILGGGAGTERIPVRVVLSKQIYEAGGKCHVSLVETVSTVIRGTPFFHERRQVVADRVVDDCR